MLAKVTSKVIGDLIQDGENSDRWNAENIAVPFFDNQQLPVTFMSFQPKIDPTFLNEADDALVNFFQKNGQDRLAISTLVYEHFQWIKNQIDEPYWSKELQNIHDVTEIWKFARPVGLAVERRSYNERDIYINIGCSCEWDQEHGLQLVFRQGKKITRVSAIDGHLTDADAYDIPDEEDDLLSKF